MPTYTKETASLHEGLEFIMETLNEVLGKPMDTWYVDLTKFLKKELDNIGAEMQQQARRAAPFDTGTLKKRIDWKREGKQFYFGIMEPHMRKFYNSSRHSPTTKRSRFTGEVVPEFSVNATTGRRRAHRYAWIVHKRDPFIHKTVKRSFNKKLQAAVNRFNKKQFNL